MLSSAKTSLAQALKADATSQKKIAFVGAGGKTTAIFKLARELAPCIVTTTTHLGAWQAESADERIIIKKGESVAKSLGDFTSDLGYTHYTSKTLLVTGETKNQRLAALSPKNLAELKIFCDSHALPLLIEADGARQKALKAPKEHEPPIPAWVDTVVVVAGLSAIGKALNDKSVYHAEGFSRLGKIKKEEKITPESLIRVLTNQEGGLKKIPVGARKIALLNQADTPKLQALGGKMAPNLLAKFDAVILTTFKPFNIQTFQHTSAIILAAGTSSRFGRAKQLLDYHGIPFVRAVTEKALKADLDSIVVVTGAEDAEIRAVLDDLPVKIVHNKNWHEGQSASIRVGVRNLPPSIGSAIFLLADQPQVTPSVMRALIEEHRQTLNPVIAPMVEGRRANPVLFDRVTFPALLELKGDIGGRGIFSKFSPSYITWLDSALLLDVDSPEDYQKLLEQS